MSALETFSQVVGVSDMESRSTSRSSSDASDSGIDSIEQCRLVSVHGFDLTKEFELDTDASCFEPSKAASDDDNSNLKQKESPRRHRRRTLREHVEQLQNSLVELAKEKDEALAQLSTECDAAVWFGQSVSNSNAALVKEVGLKDQQLSTLNSVLEGVQADTAVAQTCARELGAKLDCALSELAAERAGRLNSVQAAAVGGPGQSVSEYGYFHNRLMY